MDPKKWHLDTQYSDVLFSRNWPIESNSLLLNVFKHLDTTQAPVLSMLPPGVSPAGAAAAASMFFLPGIQAPPKPHCRIALYPGLHFVRQLRLIKFDPAIIWRATCSARALNRGYQRLHGPIDKLRLSHKKDNGEIQFHWLFKCNRVWSRMWTKEYTELSPRGHYGRGDEYTASIDFIESEHLDLFSNRYDPYDLLIYCPYFHSRNIEQTEKDFELLVSKIDNFSAHRKLIIARSPFDYWSRRLEEKLKTKGVGLSSRNLDTDSSMDVSVSLQFHIVNQFIDLGEAVVLFEDIRSAIRGSLVSHEVVTEFKFLLRRLLVSLDPNPREGEDSVAEIASRLNGLSLAMGFSSDSRSQKIIEKIISQLSTGGNDIKLQKLKSISESGKFEIWVTKDLDRQILLDFKEKNNLDVAVRLADRWMAPGIRNADRKVILSRVDREGDLDLTAYLKNDDAIVMSAWEAVVRGASIMSSWERSERWRERAKSLNIVQHGAGKHYADPVLDLAHHLDTAISNHRASASPQAPLAPQSENATWWDAQDNGSALSSNLDRSELLSKSDGTLYSCRELRFEGGFGMFVKSDDEMQTLGTARADGDIVTIAVSELEPATTIVLFKDAERGSLFDILMDQLERTSEYQADACETRKWKENLRAHVVKHSIKTAYVVSEMANRDRAVDPVTVRSWIFGSTMAPMKLEHLEALIEILQVSTIDPKQLFLHVQKLRSIARSLGRALNEILIHKDLDKLDRKIHAVLVNAGIDMDELSSALESRTLIEVLPERIEIDGRNIRKLFRV